MKNITWVEICRNMWIFLPTRNYILGIKIFLVNKLHVHSFLFKIKKTKKTKKTKKIKKNKNKKIKKTKKTKKTKKIKKIKKINIKYFDHMIKVLL
jgi:hypothetical protein